MNLSPYSKLIIENDFSLLIEESKGNAEGQWLIRALRSVAKSQSDMCAECSDFLDTMCDEEKSIYWNEQRKGFDFMHEVLSIFTAKGENS